MIGVGREGCWKAGEEGGWWKREGGRERGAGGRVKGGGGDRGGGEGGEVSELKNGWKEGRGVRGKKGWVRVAR